MFDVNCLLFQKDDNEFSHLLAAPDLMHNLLMSIYKLGAPFLCDWTLHHHIVWTLWTKKERWNLNHYGNGKKYICTVWSCYVCLMIFTAFVCPISHFDPCLWLLFIRAFTCRIDIHELFYSINSLQSVVFQNWYKRHILIAQQSRLL